MTDPARSAPPCTGSVEGPPGDGLVVAVARLGHLVLALIFPERFRR
ncbi:potassium-transporting ATPase subunit F [Streptomyces aureus]